jgi:hypothetical protein
MLGCSWASVFPLHTNIVTIQNVFMGLGVAGHAVILLLRRQRQEDISQGKRREICF